MRFIRCVISFNRIASVYGSDVMSCRNRRGLTLTHKHISSVKVSNPLWLLSLSAVLAVNNVGVTTNDWLNSCLADESVCHLITALLMGQWCILTDRWEPKAKDPKTHFTWLWQWSHTADHSWPSDSEQIKKLQLWQSSLSHLRGSSSSTNQNCARVKVRQAVTTAH